MSIRPITATLLGFLFATSANAALVSVDLSAAGDGLLTRDERTGLEWLEAPLTLGRSYNDLVGIDGSDEFAAGGDFEGFRLATTGEVQSLFVDTLGIPLTDFAQWRPASYDKVVLLHSFMGVTSGGDFAQIRAITDQSPSAGVHFQSFARICQNGVSAVCATENTANVNVNGSSISDTIGGGAWLVRQGPLALPEPGALGLLCIGLAAVAAAGRKSA